MCLSATMKLVESGLRTWCKALGGSNSQYEPVLSLPCYSFIYFFFFSQELAILARLALNLQRSVCIYLPNAGICYSSCSFYFVIFGDILQQEGGNECLLEFNWEKAQQDR